MLGNKNEEIFSRSDAYDKSISENGINCTHRFRNTERKHL
jgi:hypothetical protein